MQYHIGMVLNGQITMSHATRRHAWPDTRRPYSLVVKRRRRRYRYATPSSRGMIKALSRKIAIPGADVWESFAMPVPPRPDHERLHKRLKESERLSLDYSEGHIPATRVLADLHAAQTTPVLVGGPAVGCWSGSPRATKDVDLVIPAAQQAAAENAITSAHPELVVTYANAKRDVTRFSDHSDPDFPADRIDLICDTSPVYRIATAEAVEIRPGVRIPSAEAMVVLKCAAAMALNRSPADCAQDHADLKRILFNCPWIDQAKVQALAGQVGPMLRDAVTETLSEVGRAVARTSRGPARGR